eukprot:CAMPEP_0115615570 /NCGR_PEP_ID=MMETSP0272-20121206/22689_1 /TAXON_ID=71861 /ORGANISM="Scrippsiella trochoidea, Strain CCMP3099" /LENGTH=1079 /DNA_ID=CAMNT_0003051483 /DNA_START=195 /DNA_END=3433 /DNA_ORIENTATION=-
MRGKRMQVAKRSCQGVKHGQVSSATQPSQSTMCPHASFVRTMSTFLRIDRSQEEINHEIVKQLGISSVGMEIEALEALLSTMGKSTNAKALAAVRNALEMQGLQPSVRLYELLLRAYLGLRLQPEFAELLAEVEATGAAAPSIKVLALRAAIHASDLEASIACLLALASILKSSSSATASTAYPLLVQKLVRLASEQAALPRLLQEFSACELLNVWVLEELLEECSQRGDLAHMKESVELARAQGTELSSKARAALIRASGTVADAMSFFEGTTGQCKPDILPLVALAEAAARFSDTTLADSVLQHLPQHPSATLAAAVLRLCLAGGPLASQDEGVTVLQLFEKHFAAVDLSQDLQLQRLVADAATKCGRPMVLQKLVRSLPDSTSRAALLKSYANEQCLDGAKRVFQACPDSDACLYNALLSVCVACRDIASAEKLMSKASEAGAADVVTYNTMMKAHVQSGDLRRARALLRKMRSVGLEPNNVTFNEIIDAAAAQSSAAMWEVINEMEACGLKASPITCSILLKSIQQSSQPKDVDRALSIVESADLAMDEVLLSSLCEACIRTSRTDLLTRYLKQQRSARGVTIKSAHTYGSLIRSYGFLNDLEGVWAMWNEMQARGVAPSCITLGCMVEAVSTNGEPEAGLSLIHQMLKDKQTRSLVNAVIYCSVLKGFSHRKRFDQVWAVHEEMRKQSLQYSIVTYNALIDACVRSGEMNRVSLLLEQMSDDRIEPNVITYSTVLKGYCQDNRIDKAFEVLEDMKKSADFSPDEVTYNTLLDGCARYGMLERGLALLQDMEASHVRPSNFTLSVLVKLANRSRCPDKAFELCSELSSKYHIRLNMHVYNNLVHACTAHKNLPRALEVFEQMLGERVRPDVRTYTLLLRACVDSCKTSEAADLLRMAVGISDAPARFARFGAAIAQPKGGLTAELIGETLEGIASSCSEERLALELFNDLRNVRGLKLDSRLPMRLTAAQSARQARGNEDALVRLLMGEVVADVPAHIPRQAQLGPRGRIQWLLRLNCIGLYKGSEGGHMQMACCIMTSWGVLLPLGFVQRVHSQPSSSKYELSILGGCLRLVVC